MKALIKRRKIPKVRIVIGNVNKTKIGLTINRSIPKTTATISADVYPSTVTPGRICANINTAIAVSTSFNIIFIGRLFKS